MGNNDVVLTKQEFQKIVSDAAYKSFEDNNREFPSFDKIGKDIVHEVLQRSDRIERNPEAYRKYFQRELFPSGGACLHIQDVPEDQGVLQ